jgi:hypothetical protein
MKRYYAAPKLRPDRAISAGFLRFIPVENYNILPNKGDGAFVHGPKTK